MKIRDGRIYSLGKFRLEASLVSSFISWLGYKVGPVEKYPSHTTKLFRTSHGGALVSGYHCSGNVHLSHSVACREKNVILRTGHT